MTNCDANGVRYSVFSFNELADWCNEDLWYGSQARDLSYEAALEELRADAARQYDEWLEECVEAWHMTDGETSLEEFVGHFFELRSYGSADREAFISEWCEEMGQNIQINEPIIEGTLDGIQYRISWLGGAPLCWITKGLLGTGEELCSPCVPGAVSGSGGFLLDFENEEFNGREDFVPTHGYRCHCPPREWVRQ